MRYKTLTQEGTRRKRDRLIMQALQKKNPRLFAELAAQADKQIEEDNTHPFSKIVDHGLGVVHRASDELRQAQEMARQHKKAVINERIGVPNEAV
jgi:hypothetical protein